MKYLTTSMALLMSLSSATFAMDIVCVDANQRHAEKKAMMLAKAQYSYKGGVVETSGSESLIKNEKTTDTYEQRIMSVSYTSLSLESEIVKRNSEMVCARVRSVAKN